MIGITAQNDADYYLTSCDRSGKPAGPAEYELAAVEAGEPAGEWLIRGANPLGLAGDVEPDDFRTLVNQLRDPATHESLGARPRRYKSRAQRVARVERENPHATPEELAALRLRAERTGRGAVHAYDLTFSLPKSWSVLHAGLQRAGRHEDAEQVWAAARAGIEAALDHAVAEHGWTRSGTHGPKVAGRTTGRYERATDWTAALFRHHTSRDQDPQLHAHVMLLNRVQLPDGRWLALHAAPLYRSKHALDAVFLRVAETELHHRLGVSFAASPTGPAREIVGVAPEVRELFSSRSRALGDDAQQAVDEFVARNGRAPHRLVMWRLRERATLGSRRTKAASQGRGADLDRWEEAMAADFQRGLADVVDAVDDARAGAEGEPIGEIDPDAVIERALADLEARKSTWSRSHLTHAISQQLPDILPIEAADVPELLTALTDAALRSRDLVDLVPPPAVAPPASLTDPASGASVFEAPEGGRWTTAAYRARESSLVARLDQRGASSIPEATAAAVVRGRGLSPEQSAVTEAILASDARVQLVNAPAGTGKSHVLGALDTVARDSTGRGLLGLATARNAANVMAVEGVSRATSIAAFLDHHDRAVTGADYSSEPRTMRMRQLERARVAQVVRGDTVLIDEASMVSTPDLARVMDVLDRLGAGRVILVGDTEQVDAVEHGGAFAMLIEQRAQARRDAGIPADMPAPVHQLDEVRRFERQWERDASARLRGGDADALTRYDARGRISGGDLEAARDDAVRDMVTDHLSGRDCVVVTATGERASEVASLVREALVQAGHVDRYGVTLIDKTVAGIGDLIQTRENRHDLGVINRERWQVVGASDRGDLEARRVAGRDEYGRPRYDPSRTLPADYVAHHVALAYAGTVHAVQGRTTDVSRTLAEPGMSRDQLYPAITRGREGNYAYVVLDRHRQQQLASAQAWVDTLAARVDGREVDGREVDGREPVPRGWSAAAQLDNARERLDHLQAQAQTPLGRLADIVERDDRSLAALTVAAQEQDRQRNLGHLAPQWTQLVAEIRDTETRAAIRDVAGRDADRVLADPQGAALFTMLRSAEATGHDARHVLERAMARGGLDGARSPARVLYARVDRELGPSHGTQPVRFGFLGRTPEASTFHGRAHVERASYARDLAQVMDSRTLELGRHVADETPPWAVNLLGPAPQDKGERGLWGARAAPAAALREAYGRTDERDAVGPQPTRAEPERLALWNQAVGAAGVDYRAAQLAGLSRAELELREQTWTRELSWIPRNVDEHLRDAHLAVAEARQQEVEARSRGDDAIDQGSAVLAMTQRTDDLERIAQVRADALDATRQTREAAAEARAERDRRGDVDRAARDEPEPDRSPPPKQEQEPERERAAPSREPAPEREPAPARDNLTEQLTAAQRAVDILAERKAGRGAERDAERAGRDEPHRSPPELDRELVD